MTALAVEMSARRSTLQLQLSTGLDRRAGLGYFSWRRHGRCLFRGKSYAEWAIIGLVASEFEADFMRLPSHPSTDAMDSHPLLPYTPALPILDTSRSPCDGLALVRSVSSTELILYVLTPLPAQWWLRGSPSFLLGNTRPHCQERRRRGR